MRLKAVAVQAALLLAAGAVGPLLHAQTAGSDDLVDGRDYQSISPAQPTSVPGGKVEVTEVFMYSCPHCYAFEPMLQDWEKSKADYVEFVRLPASWNRVAKLHAQAYYTAQVLGKLGEMDQAFFHEFHVQHNFLDTTDKLRDFFGRYGVDAKTFDKTFDSPEVRAKMQHADDLIERYGVTGTPSLVVNGKYLTMGSMAGSYERWFAIVDELAKREHDAAAPN
ncbi:MAG TPA: thiol:disulfide interchange protein DsbA/DsbL [Gammaproteobacteria bacterium]|nr:thiol:disulfide interchange protein DsbA/DsbL [Gammaproteobacteria bacterium]